MDPDFEDEYADELEALQDLDDGIFYVLYKSYISACSTQPDPKMIKFRDVFNTQRNQLSLLLYL